MKVNIAEASLSPAEIAAATRVLESGALRQGKECQGFEVEFAEYVDAAFGVTCSNGSASLHLAFMTFLEPGDEVLVPSMTFVATANMVVAAGGIPVLCDVDPGSFLIDLDDAGSRVTERTRAIVPVHLHGNVVDVDSVQAFADKHDLRVVWDAAQAHGARYKGRGVGAFNDFVSYSFYPSKNMFVGEGGMICTNDEGLENMMRFMRTHGQTAKNHHTMFGHNFRMTDVEASIGREQLKRIEPMMDIRRRNAAVLTAGLADTEGVTPQVVTPETDHGWHQFSVVVDEQAFGCDRDALGARLRDRGIGTGVHYPKAVHQQPVYQERYGVQSLPHAEHLAATLLSIPVHHGMTEEDAHFVVGQLLECRATPSS